MQTRYIGGSSAAYDLEKFEPKQRVRGKKPTLVVAKPSSKVREKVRMASTLKLLATVVLVAAIVITMLYSRAMLTELNQKLDAESTRLAEEQSESTRLTAELEAKISLRNVEQYATQTLGMSPMDKHQVTYVDLSEGDKIELTSESPKQSLIDRIQLAISNVQEYIPQD
ncbi:hypothetical protein V6615_10870 [Oscillospiraceae bacterium PP1C4]